MRQFVSDSESDFGFLPMQHGGDQDHELHSVSVYTKETQEWVEGLVIRKYQLEQTVKEAQEKN